jgi:hypothetical protein
MIRRKADFGQAWVFASGKRGAFGPDTSVSTAQEAVPTVDNENILQTFRIDWK